MGARQSFLVIDDDQGDLAQITALLREAGHEVSAASDGKEALNSLTSIEPDCVVLKAALRHNEDICKGITSLSRRCCAKVVVMAASDDNFSIGADDFAADALINQPIEQQRFLGEMEQIVNHDIALTLWGVRGTLPVPGPTSLRYGGNTPCCSIETSDGQLFIFDAGSGIKALSDTLVKKSETGIEARILISHPHWDHINALPFFAPLYTPGNTIEILGARNSDMGVRDLISSQMDGVFFPITLHAFGAQVTFRDIGEETITFGDVQISTMLLNHPGACLGYRVDYHGHSICYVTDNELYPKESGFYNAGYRDKLRHFISGADAVVTDSTYLDADYPSHIHWGHSAVGEVSELAHSAGVKTLHLFHHDPDQDDDAIDLKLEKARQRLEQLGSSTVVVAPSEGSIWRY